MSAVRTLGDLELVEDLATGGMADLYLARSPRYPGEVVVKRIQQRYADHIRVVKMFIDEGRIAKALEHPNVVRILDVGHAAGSYFIVMEYIRGPDLLAVCRRGVEIGNFMARPLAVALLHQTARGLCYAHERRDHEGRALSIVHCDISPGNVVVSWGGTAKIVDFGIARAAIQLRLEDHSVAGKYNYMAPEQIRGEPRPIDARADLFALGVILYELTVGHRLFRGRPEQVMRLVCDEPITPPSQVVADYPADLEAIVMRCLERDRERRYASARALRDDLGRWLAAQPDGPAGKVQIAAYLREVFGAPRVKAAAAGANDEFGIEDTADGRRRGSPAGATLLVDAADPPELDEAGESGAVPMAISDLPTAPMRRMERDEMSASPSPSPVRAAGSREPLGVAGAEPPGRDRPEPPGRDRPEPPGRDRPEPPGRERSDRFALILVLVVVALAVSYFLGGA